MCSNILALMPGHAGVIGRWYAAAVVSALVLSMSVPGAARADDVLASGSPPLTVSLANTSTWYFEWALDTPSTAAQRQAVQDGLVQGWQRNDAFVMTQAVYGSQLLTDAAQAGVLQDPQLQNLLLTNLLTNLRTNSSPLATTLISSYAAAHTSIANGTPPLTRQMADALAEMMVFMVAQVSGNSFSVDQAREDAFAQKLQKTYPSASSANQQALAQVPERWAQLQRQWPTLPESTRSQLRAYWKPSVERFSPDVTAADGGQTTPGLRSGVGSSGWSVIDAEQRNFDEYLGPSMNSSLCLNSIGQFGGATHPGCGW